MKFQQVAVLLTCHNRKNKTLSCLASLLEAELPENYAFDVYLTDDGSTDGTSETVKKLYPQVNVIIGNGNLYWAGGMRLAWKEAMRRKTYDAYLLLNDDVKLCSDFLINLIKTDQYSLAENGKSGIYSGATVDDEKQSISYGASKITTNHLVVRMEKLSPKTFPQKCEITNANVLWVSKYAVDKIGIFDSKYTHGIADYDYSLQAVKNDIPVYLAPGVSGVCANDHGKNWKRASVPLKGRIEYLKSPTGLAYSDYMYYIKKHFPMFLPYSFMMLWIKTFFPFLWDKFKIQG